MIRETITFTFTDEEQQRRFHSRLKAQTGPLTTGQQIVAWWETSSAASEPADLAEKIDEALIQAVRYCTGCGRGRGQIPRKLDAGGGG